jgi:hypothetical protein
MFIPDGSIQPQQLAPSLDAFEHTIKDALILLDL